MAFTPSATSAGSAIRQAPNAPRCTRSLAAAVQIDLVIAPVLAQLRGKGQLQRLAAAELQRHRVLLRMKAQVPAQVAMAQRAGGHHLCIEAGVGRQQAVEVPAVPIRPVQHRRNT